MSEAACKKRQASRMSEKKEVSSFILEEPEWEKVYRTKNKKKKKERVKAAVVILVKKCTTSLFLVSIKTNDE